MAVSGQKNGFNPSPWLKRVARISAWALLASVVVLVLSGWGITQTGIIYRITLGLIDRRLADAIHREVNLPLAIFFLAHVLINIKIGISQHHPSRAWLTNILLGITGAALLMLVIYMEYFRLGG
jgi:intracellular septation protein A